VRFLAAESRQANYAEIEFYGKRDRDAPEERLTGNIIGAPAISADDAHPYTHAMDGNLETWFEKPRPRPKECWASVISGPNCTDYQNGQQGGIYKLKGIHDAPIMSIHSSQAGLYTALSNYMSN
jgi:hypothetical protein